MDVTLLGVHMALDEITTNSNEELSSTLNNPASYVGSTNEHALKPASASHKDNEMNAEVTFSYRLSGVRSMQNHYRELAELIGEESDENMIGHESNWEGDTSESEDDEYGDERRHSKRKVKSQASPGKSVQSPPRKPAAKTPKKVVLQETKVAVASSSKAKKRSYAELAEAFSMSPTKKQTGMERSSKAVKTGR